MKLPNATHAAIPIEKLRDYLLSSSHPVGRFKAGFFQSLGYDGGDAGTLETDLRGLLQNDAEESDAMEFGKKYLVRGNITGPNGRSADVVTVWIIHEGETSPRFSLPRTRRTERCLSNHSTQLSWKRICQAMD